MDDMDTMITLIGARLAKEGNEFIFEGQAPECDRCRLKNTCMGLEKGRKYRIVKLKNDTVHECFVHDEGARVVEVIKAPVQAVIDSKKAVKGAKIRYQQPKFRDIEDEELFDLLNPEGIKNGDRCTIVNVLESIEADNTTPGNLKKVELVA